MMLFLKGGKIEMKREKREKMTKVLVVVMTIVFIASILPMFLPDRSCTTCF